MNIAVVIQKSEKKRKKDNQETVFKKVDSFQINTKTHFNFLVEIYLMYNLKIAEMLG